MIAEMQTIDRRLAVFLASMLEISWTGSDASGADIQEEALRLGLIEETTFDPTTHHDPSGAAEAGDTYFVVSTDVQRALDGTRTASPLAEPGNDGAGG